MAYKKASMIAKLKHRVALCTMHDVVEEDGVMSLTRADVLHAWANIVPKVGTMFNPGGNAIEESREKKSHEIYIRYRRDIDITSAAWIYEERLESPPRWFKVLSELEKEDYWCFKCRLVERSIDATPPAQDTGVANVAAPLPPGVYL